MKEYLLREIDTTINALIKYSEYLKKEDKKIFERIAVILEESKINLKNNRYFNIPNITEQFNIKNEYLKNDIEILQKNIDEFFYNICFDYVKNHPNYSSLPKQNIKDYVETLSAYPELYEEAINIILNGIDNIETFVVTNGYTTKDIMKIKKLPFISCYPFHMAMMHEELPQNNLLGI